MKWRNVTLLTVGESGLRRNTPEAAYRPIPAYPSSCLFDGYVDGYVVVSSALGKEVGVRARNFYPTIVNVIVCARGVELYSSFRLIFYIYVFDFLKKLAWRREGKKECCIRYFMTLRMIIRTIVRIHVLYSESPTIPSDK